MRNALKALIKLAMDAGYSDEDIARMLNTAATAILTNKFFTLWD